MKRSHGNIALRYYRDGLPFLQPIAAMAKVRDSGMPAEEMWDSFFDPAKILGQLRFGERPGLVVEFGCGHGTFTIPAARRCEGPSTRSTLSQKWSR